MINASENNANAVESIKVDVIFPIEFFKESLVWTMFEKINLAEAKCYICKRLFKTKYGNTSGLFQHLRRQHPKEAGYKKDAETQTAVTRASETKTARTQTAKTRTAETSNNIAQNINLEISERAELVTNAIARMIILDLQPFSIVNDKGFKELMNTMQPQYEIPSGTTFSREIIPKMYENKKKEITNQINTDIKNGINTIAITLTTDGWTSRSVESYLCLTLHYSTKNFEIRRYMLNLQYLPKTYTSSYLHQILKNLLTTWDLNIDKPVYFITEHEENLVAAIDMNESWIRIPCFAHSLQLAVKSALQKLPQYAVLFKKCKTIVSFFSHSSTAGERFIQMQTALNQNVPALQLIQKKNKRWNSTYAMLEKLILLRPYLNEITYDDNMPRNLSDDEWDLLQSIVNVLEPIEEIIKIMSRDTYPTLSQYVPLYILLTYYINELRQDNQPNELISTNLCKELEEHFEPLRKNDTLLLAMVLDPRYKDRLLVNNERAEIIKKLKERINSNIHTVNTQPTSNTFNCNNNDSQSRVLQFFITQLESSENEVNTIETNINCEIQTYLSEKVEPFHTNIINWWKCHSTQFPLLANIARHLLAIPATRSSSERLFSQAENIVTSARSRLLLENIEEWCFLHYNLQ